MALESYDDNKKVKGIKRHAIVENKSFLIAVMMAVGHIYDSKAVILLMRVLKDMLIGIKVIIAEGDVAARL